MYEYTAKSNLVAVITNGTAVGLGDIGPEASSLLWKEKGYLKFLPISMFLILKLTLM